MQLIQGISDNKYIPKDPEAFNTMAGITENLAMPSSKHDWQDQILD